MSPTTATTILEYNDLQSGENKQICNLLQKKIDEALPDATSKIWHGGPVWFLNDNPVAGYWVRKEGVQLLFWSGQSFDEPELKPEGTFKAAQKIYLKASEIDIDALGIWLKKASEIQWDYKNIVKNKGKLERLHQI